MEKGKDNKKEGKKKSHRERIKRDISKIPIIILIRYKRSTEVTTKTKTSNIIMKLVITMTLSYPTYCNKI